MKYKQLILLPVFISLTACGATAARYKPVVDQPNANYSADLANCQKLAETRSYLNDDVKTAALAGAVAGTVLGLGDWDDSLGGAVIGSLIGAGGQAWDTREERKDIVMQCLRGRNHLIAG
jgi:hypothetical protein